MSTSETRRYEIKMTCDTVYFPHLQAWLRLHPYLFSEAYPSRQVNGLYFDTYELDALNDNLLGVSNRQKLRFRWYGDDYSNVEGILELKQKTNQVGWKNRCPIPTAFDLTTISWQTLLQSLRAQADDLFVIYLSQMRQPTLLVSYKRLYYESASRQIRVTIDYNQIVYPQIISTAPNLVNRIIDTGKIVIEVKSDIAHYRDVSNVLSSLPLQVSRNSKYVNGLVEFL